jgi:hypothetical protein
MSPTRSLSVFNVAAPVADATVQVVPSHGHREVATNGGGFR